MYFPVTFKDEHEYDANNPNHRRKDRSVKTNALDEYLPNIVCWFRALAGIGACRGGGVIGPRPPRVLAEIERLRPLAAGVDVKTAVQEFVAERMRPVQPGTCSLRGEKPKSRTEIVDACIVYVAALSVMNIWTDNGNPWFNDPPPAVTPTTVVEGGAGG